MNRDSNGFITTDSELLGFEVPVLYSGASGINVDNENYVISFTGTAYGSGGKTYQGVAPIVVNNDEDKISANTTPFGVQSPLYFAQDDESGCVIGFSGDIPSGDYLTTADASSFVSTAQYAVDSATFLTAHQSLAGYATETYVNENISGKADKSEIPDVSNFITNTSAETTYQPIGNYLSSNALEGYATTSWVDQQGYLTAVPSSYVTDTDLESVSGNITALIPDTNNFVTTSDLDNYYLKTETSSKEEIESALSSLTGGDEEVNDIVRTNSGYWSDKVDSSALTGYALESTVESVSSSITSMIPSTAGLASETYVDENTSGKADKSEIPDVSNFITNVSAEETYLTKNEASTSYQTIDGMTAYQPVGDYLTADALVPYSADWNTVSSKLDESAFSTVSGTFLTAHQSLAGYATTSDLQQTSGNIIALIPTDYYPDSNPSGFITGVDLTPYQTTAGMVNYQTTAGMSNYATTGDVSYLSAEIGNVEILLASL